MSTLAEIHEAKAAAVELALEELQRLHGKLPVATADDLKMTAASVGLCVAQLKVCAKQMEEAAAVARPPVAAWWQ